LKRVFKIVGEATDGIEVVEMAGKLKPDIVLMDIGMPKMNGLKATKAILNKYNDIKVLVLSAYNDEEFLDEFLKCGAKGYILKNNSSGEIISAIEKVMQGHIYIDPEISQIVFNKVISQIEKKETMNAVHLTEREKEVLVLVADGKLNKEIADCLEISIKTVIAHRENIKEKLGLHSVALLTRYAIEMGYVELNKN
jgi:two-component system nitrate/nitrite response regulator NarL